LIQPRHPPGFENFNKELVPKYAYPYWVAGQFICENFQKGTGQNLGFYLIKPQKEESW